MNDWKEKENLLEQIPKENLLEQIPILLLFNVVHRESDIIVTNISLL